MTRLRLYSDTNFSYVLEAVQSLSDSDRVTHSAVDLEINFPDDFYTRNMEFIEDLADEYYGDIYFGL